MKIKIRSPSFCKDTLDDLGDVEKDAQDSKCSILCILFIRSLEVKFGLPIKVATGFYIVRPMLTPCRNFRLVHTVKAWCIGLDVKDRTLVIGINDVV